MKKKKRNKIIKWTIMVIVIASVGVGSYLMLTKDASSLEASTTLTKRTATVASGDVLQTISASSTLETSNTTTYKAPSQGELVTFNVTNGEYVTKGDLLAAVETTTIDEKKDGYNDQIDSNNEKIEDTLESIEATKEDIIDLQEDILDVTDSINEKNQDILDLQTDMQLAEDSKSELMVYAPFSGVIFDVKVSTGDTVNDGTTIATISDTTLYEVDLTIRSKAIYGDINSIDVYYKNTKFEGTLISYADYTYKDEFNNELVDIILQFSMETGIPEKEKVSAIITTDNIASGSYNESVPYYANSQTITSTKKGEITSLSITEKKSVSAGELLAVLDESYVEDEIETLENQIDTITNQIESYNNQIESYNDQIESREKAITTYEETIIDYNETIDELLQSIEDLQEDYDDLQIVATFNGIVSDASASVGDQLTSNTTLFTITSLDSPELTISIDELDITKVKLNMEASVVIDAIESTITTPVKATVTNISMNGKSSGGVTTYSVTVTLTEDVEGLMLSMNSTATIFIDKSEDTLYIPIEAISLINGKSYVYIESNDTQTTVITDTTTKQSSAGERSDMDTSQMTDKQKAAAMSKSTDTQTANISDTSTKQSSARERSNMDTSQMTDEQKAAFEQRTASMSKSTDAINQVTSSANSLIEYYTGTSLVEVETGVYNESYIEILSGLAEGQIIVLPPTYTTESTEEDEEEAAGLNIMGGIAGSGTGRTPGTNNKVPTGGK